MDDLPLLQASQDFFDCNEGHKSDEGDDPYKCGPAKHAESHQTIAPHNKVTRIKKSEKNENSDVENIYRVYSVPTPIL